MFWTVIGFVLLACIAIVGLFLVCMFISESTVWTNFVEKRFVKKHGDKIKSDAFVAGYKHLAAWSGVELSNRIYVIDEEKFKKYEYVYNHIRSDALSPYYSKEETVQNITVDEYNRPSAKKADLRKVAEKQVEFDLSKALNSRRWLGGTKQEFEDYYAGAAKFMADVSDAEAELTEEKYEKLRQDKLIEARRQGLREVSTRLSKDMEALTEARTRLFSTESVESQWAALERACAADDTVVS